MLDYIKTFPSAKINLFLKVLNKRNDGYHNIQSLLVKTDLRDVLEVEISNDFQIEIHGEFSNLININDNIFIPIFNFFKKNFNLDKQLKIKLQKNIPVGAGLGGGSADGAEFIKTINKIFNLNLDKKELQKISLQFGSDLPFFFEEKSAIISMKGEEIIVYDKSFDLDILIVKPSNNLATREVFENFKNDFSSLISTEKILSKSVIDISKEINNDLTKSAVAIVPQISQILDEFKNFNCLVAKMSGSGSSCFAIFDNLSQMNECEIFFKQKYQNYFIKKTKICN